MLVVDEDMSAALLFDVDAVLGEDMQLVAAVLGSLLVFVMGGVFVWSRWWAWCL